MPQLLIPIHEFNHCHEPGGKPEGGQFCGDDTEGDLTHGRGGAGYQLGWNEQTADGLRRMRNALMDQSFNERGTVHETLDVINVETGELFAETMHGNEDSVEVPQEVWKGWLDHGPVVVAHTHPGSGTFSFDDFMLMNKVNRAGANYYDELARTFGSLGVPKNLQAEASRRKQLPVKAMQVYGEDGSWYEIKFHKVYSLMSGLDLMQKDYEEKRQLAVDFAVKETTAWANEHGIRGRNSLEVRLEAQKTGQLNALNAHFGRVFRDKAAPIWSGLAAKYGFEYRYHLAH